jgi:hypothetical protein
VCACVWCVGTLKGVVSRLCVVPSIVSVSLITGSEIQKDRDLGIFFIHDLHKYSVSAVEISRYRNISTVQ